VRPPIAAPTSLPRPLAASSRRARGDEGGRRVVGPRHPSGTWWADSASRACASLHGYIGRRCATSSATRRCRRACAPRPSCSCRRCTATRGRSRSRAGVSWAARGAVCFATFGCRGYVGGGREGGAEAGRAALAVGRAAQNLFGCGGSRCFFSLALENRADNALRASTTSGCKRSKGIYRASKKQAGKWGGATRGWGQGRRGRHCVLLCTSRHYYTHTIQATAAREAIALCVGGLYTAVVSSAYGYQVRINLTRTYCMG
jgi:hypothetical protein